MSPAAADRSSAPSGGAPQPSRPRRRRSHLALYAAIPVAVVVIVLLVVLAVSGPSTESAKTPLLGKQAPTLNGQLVDVANGTVGRSFSLTDPPGKWVAVNFYASWCVPCQQEATALHQWAEAHEKTGDAQLVQVVFQDTPAKSAAALRQDGGASWPLLAGDDGQIAIEWGVVKTPETYLVAPDGTIVAKTIQPVTESLLDGWIARFSGGNGSSGAASGTGSGS